MSHITGLLLLIIGENNEFYVYKQNFIKSIIIFMTITRYDLAKSKMFWFSVLFNFKIFFFFLIFLRTKIKGQKNKILRREDTVFNFKD